MNLTQKTSYPILIMRNQSFSPMKFWGLVTTLMCCHVIQTNQLTVLLHGLGSNAQELPAEREEGAGLPLPLAAHSSIHYSSIHLA